MWANSLQFVIVAKLFFQNPLRLSFNGDSSKRQVINVLLSTEKSFPS